MSHRGLFGGHLASFPPPGGALRLVNLSRWPGDDDDHLLEFSVDCQELPGYQNFGAYAFTLGVPVSSDYISLSETLLELSCGGKFGGSFSKAEERLMYADIECSPDY